MFMKYELTWNTYFFILFFFFKKKNHMPVSETYRNQKEGSFGVLNFRDLGISTAENAENKK